MGKRLFLAGCVGLGLLAACGAAGADGPEVTTTITSTTTTSMVVVPGEGVYDIEANEAACDAGLPTCVPPDTRDFTSAPG